MIVENLVGTDIDFTGTVTASAGSGILIQNNNLAGAKTIDFTAQTTLNTVANDGVELINNDTATITFSGGLDITTTSGGGIDATAGAAGINVTGAGNTVTSTTGKAVNINASTIGAITFQSVSANGGTHGIDINNGGTTGSFTVTGTGTTNGSGGTIQSTTQNGILIQSTDNITLKNMTLTDAANDGAANCTTTVFTGCNAAVEFNTVKVVDIDNMSITNATNHGIFGQTVTDLDINDSDIDGLGADVTSDDHGIFIFNLLGTVAGTTASVFDNVTIDDTQDTSILIRNTTATNPGNASSPDQLSVINSNLTDAGDNGLQVLTTATNANFNLIATGNTITNTVEGVDVVAEAGDLQATVGGAAGLANTISAGTGNMVNGIVFFANASVDDATANATAENNTITLDAAPSVSGLNGVGVSAGGQSSGNLGTIRATVKDNIISSTFSGVLTQTVHGVITTNEGTGTTSQNVILIDNNSITLNPPTGTNTAETVGIGVDGGTTGAGTTVRITNNDPVIANGDASNGASVGIQILPTELNEPAGTGTRVCARVTGNNVSTPNNPFAGAFGTTELDVIAAPVITGSFLDVEAIPVGVRTPLQLVADIEADNTNTEVGDTTGLIAGTITGVASCPN